MTPYEKLKARQKSALIVVCTLGLAVPFSLKVSPNNSNLFEGLSFYKGDAKLPLKIISYLFMVMLFAIPSFFIYLIILIVTTIQLLKY